LFSERSLTFAVIGLLVWGAVASGVAGYYYSQSSTYRQEYQSLVEQLNLSIKVDMLLKQSQTDMKWCNDTYLPMGSTAFTAVMSKANVTYQSYGEMGNLVTSIDGLANNATMGWFYWQYNATAQQWSLPTYSADKYLLQEGDMIAWAFGSYETWPPQPPT